jgi:4'-phosphopantetheinyl transferase
MVPMLPCYSEQVKLDKFATMIWCIPLAVTADEAEACRAVLSEAEQQQAERFHFDWLRRRYIVAHGRMRIILTAHTGVPAHELRFQTTQYGKPFLDPFSNLHFNLSHSGELAILAVGANELGVDVEFIRPLEDFENIATGFFSDQEVASLQQYPAAERLRAFYRCWTRKEAFVKAIGEGLSIPLSSFVVSLAEENAALLETNPPEHSRRWTMAALDLGPEYVGAVVIREQSSTLETRWWGNCELVMTPDKREDESKGEQLGNKKESRI